MNKQNKIEFKYDPINCIRDYLFNEIKKVVIDREIEINMIERDLTSEKLLFKSTSHGMEIFNRYVELLYVNRGEALYDHLTDVLQYMKLTQKGGSDYQEKRE